MVGAGAGIDGAFGGTLGAAFVGGDDAPADAAGGGADGAVGAGAGIEGNFGGPGIAGKTFVGGAAAAEVVELAGLAATGGAGGGGGAAEPAGFAAAAGADGLGKPPAGRVGSVAGRAPGRTFAPAGAGVVLPAALSAVGGFGGAGGSLGGMKGAS